MEGDRKRRAHLICVEADSVDPSGGCGFRWSVAPRAKGIAHLAVGEAEVDW